MTAAPETGRMADLAGLIERLTAASRPDRELDVAIIAALYNARLTVIADKTAGDWTALVNDNNEMVPYSPLTNSIDAALALVEAKLPGCVWTKNAQDQVALSRYPTKPMIIGMGWHPHIPIAILIALLEALEARP